jgi:hypothetical protein
VQIKLRTTDHYSPVKQWLKDRGIFSDLYELGYDFVDPLTSAAIELVPVLKIDNGVLSGADLTEFVLRFGV